MQTNENMQHLHPLTVSRPCKHHRPRTSAGVRLSSLAGLLFMAGCYISHGIEQLPDVALVGESDAAPNSDVNVPDVNVPDVVVPDVVVPDANVPDANVRLCGCPGREVACSLPEMCCPVTRSCQDPNRFRCSGSAVACD